jgi:hypothetical protein
MALENSDDTDSAVSVTPDYCDTTPGLPNSATSALMLFYLSYHALLSLIQIISDSEIWPSPLSALPPIISNSVYYALFLVLFPTKCTTQQTHPSLTAPHLAPRGRHSCAITFQSFYLAKNIQTATPPHHKGLVIEIH